MTDSSPSAAVADPWPDAVALAAPGVVGISDAAASRRGHASGWIWRVGVVVTTASALWRVRRPQLVLPDGATVAAELRGADPNTDLALLVGPQVLQPVALPAPALSPWRVGDAVAAVGRDADGLLHASFGRIGQVGPAWRTWRGGRVDERIRLDGGLYRGLDGAPVIDGRGGFVGIASGALSRQHGVVLPPATVLRVGELLLAHGQVAHGYLGLSAQPVLLPAAVAADSGEREGLLISALAEDGPAAAAGAMVGDLLVRVGGAAVADLGALREQLGAERVGQPVELALWRGGRGLQLTATVAARPQRRRCG